MKWKLRKKGFLEKGFNREVRVRIKVSFFIIYLYMFFSSKIKREVILVDVFKLVKIVLWSKVVELEMSLEREIFI